MKITKKQLTRIIKEELSRLLKESSEQRFAELRGLLLKPSEENWNLLISLFLQWQGKEDFDVALDYAKAHLSGEKWLSMLGDVDPEKTFETLTNFEGDVDLSNSKINCDGVKAIANSPLLQNVKTLDLRNNNIKGSHILPFLRARRDQFKNLKVLDLRNQTFDFDRLDGQRLWEAGSLYKVEIRISLWYRRPRYFSDKNTIFPSYRSMRRGYPDMPTGLFDDDDDDDDW